jgi:predicted nuclease of predicted toxin-antitoxin system
LKLLVDMNLSPSWVEALRAMGFEAVHWSNVGDPRASDRKLFEYAAAESYTVFTNDLDFGAILAASGSLSPSVIQVRATELTPARLGPLVERALGQYRELLEAGALITVEAARLRARILPLKRRSGTTGLG